MSGLPETQQIWEETLQRLINVSSLTVKQNNDLNNRVQELEVEIAVWKQAHANTLEASEREARAHRLQLSALNKQLSGIDLFKAQDPLILCVINGEKTLFSDSLLSEGHLGGRMAAQMVTQAIAERLANEDVQLFPRLSYWVYLYISKIELATSLAERDICSVEQFEAFLLGFSQASARFSVVDVGPGQDVVDCNIKEYLKTFAMFPQTMRVFVSGGAGGSYASLFEHLENDQVLGKLVMLCGNPEETEAFSLPTLVIDGLFRHTLISPSTPPGPPLSVRPVSAINVTKNGGLISPKSPSPTQSKSVDPNLPLHKQAPPPCNEHYLMTCSKGPGLCKYSHDYILNADQLATLAANAKKAPCNWLKNGLRCPYGQNCCWGHVCPNGPNCYHKSKGKCWFKGMH